MDNFTYQYPVRQHFGKGCAERAIKEEMGRAGRNVLLAYGGGSLKRTGLYDRLRGWLHECGKHVVDFGGIRPSSWRTPTGDARSRWPDYTASVWQHRATSALPLTPPTRAEARESHETWTSPPTASRTSTAPATSLHNIPAWMPAASACSGSVAAEATLSKRPAGHCVRV